MDTLLQLIGILAFFFLLGSLEAHLRAPKYHKSSHKPVDTDYFNPSRKPKPQPTIGPDACPELFADLTPKPNYMYISAEAKQAYLSSPTWFSLRTKAMDRADHRCQLCSSITSLHCHHLRYDWLSEGGANELADVVILCELCHQRQHDYYGYDRTTDYSKLV